MVNASVPGSTPPNQPYNGGGFSLASLTPLPSSQDSREYIKLVTFTAHSEGCVNIRINGPHTDISTVLNVALQQVPQDLKIALNLSSVPRIDEETVRVLLKYGKASEICLLTSTDSLQILKRLGLVGENGHYKIPTIKLRVILSPMELPNLGEPEPVLTQQIEASFIDTLLKNKPQVVRKSMPIMQESAIELERIQHPGFSELKITHIPCGEEARSNLFNLLQALPHDQNFLINLSEIVPDSTLIENYILIWCKKRMLAGAATPMLKVAPGTFQRLRPEFGQKFGFELV
jgi:hypothetical protein